MLSADVARGDGNDNSAFHVIDMASREQVAEYVGRIPTDRYAELINRTAKIYNNAIVAIENNSYGWAVLSKLKDLEYKNIYYSHKSKTKGGVGMFAYEGRKDYVMGIPTSAGSRPLYVSKLEEMVRNKQIRIYSERTLDEMKSFVWNNGRPEAQKGCNDDTILAMSIAAWLLDVIFAGMLNQEELDKVFVSCISMTSSDFESIKELSGISNSLNMAESALFFGNVDISNSKKRLIKKELGNLNWLY